MSIITYIAGLFANACGSHVCHRLYRPKKAHVALLQRPEFMQRTTEESVVNYDTIMPELTKSIARILHDICDLFQSILSVYP